MPKPRVFVTRAIPDKGFEMLRDFCDVDLWPDESPPGRLELLQHVLGKVDEAGPQLKVISNHAVDVDNIDINAATARKEAKQNP